MTPGQLQGQNGHLLKVCKDIIWKNLLHWMGLEINGQGWHFKIFVEKNKPSTKMIILILFP